MLNFVQPNPLASLAKEKMEAVNELMLHPRATLSWAAECRRERAQ